MGTKLCVNVIAAKRPQYLYVCLDAIFRNTIVPDVYVYIDMLENGTVWYKENLEMIAPFAVRAVYVNDRHKAPGGNFWDSFKNAFSLGYDYCLHLEEDWLITTDAIQWLYECPKITSMYSLHRWTDRIEIDPCGNNTILRDGDNLSWCVAFDKEVFRFVYDIYKAKLHYGFYDTQKTEWELDRFDNYDWDKVLVAIAKRFGLTQLIPPKSLLAHFGNKSSIEFGYASPSTIDIDLFSGNRRCWLDNIAKMFDELDEQTKRNLAWLPIDFRYV